MLESPKFEALLGSINLTVAAFIVPSSVSLVPIAETVTGLSSFAVFPKLSTATGGSLTGVTVIFNLASTSSVPSVIV